MHNDPRGHSKYRRIAKSVVLGKACYWCGAPATEADHLVPVKHDPSRAKDRSNLVPSCTHCNRSKGARATPRPRLEPAWRPRSVFSTQRNHIPVFRQIYTHSSGRVTLRADYRREVADARR